MRTPTIVITALARIEAAVNAVQRAFRSMGAFGAQTSRMIGNDWQQMVRHMEQNMNNLRSAAHRVFRDIEQQAFRMRMSIGGIFRGVGLLPGMGMMFGAGGFGALAGGFTLLALESLKFKQNMVGALDAMLKSEEAAEGMFETLQHWADITPFEMEETVEAGKQLLAYSLASKDNIKEMLDLVGDAAFAMKVPMTQVIHALEFARAGMAHIRMLAPIGISREDLKARGVQFETTGQVAETSRGKVYDALLGALQERFGGTMEKLATSFEARWTTALSNVRRLAMALGAGLFESVGNALAKINEAFDMLFKSAEGQRFITILKMPFDVLGNILSGWAEKAKPFIAWLDQLLTYERVSQLLLTLAANLEAIWSRILKGIEANLGKLPDSAEDFAKIWDWILNVVNKVFGSVMGVAYAFDVAVKIARRFFRDMEDSIMDVIENFQLAITNAIKMAMNYVEAAFLFIGARLRHFLADATEAIDSVFKALALTLVDTFEIIFEETGIKAALEWMTGKKFTSAAEARQKVEDYYKPNENNALGRMRAEADRLAYRAGELLAGIEQIEKEGFKVSDAVSKRRALRDAKKAAELEAELKAEGFKDPKAEHSPWERIQKAFNNGTEAWAKEIEARMNRIAKGGLIPEKWDAAIAPMHYVVPGKPIDPGKMFAALRNADTTGGVAGKALDMMLGNLGWAGKRGMGQFGSSDKWVWGQVLEQLGLSPNRPATADEMRRYNPTPPQLSFMAGPRAQEIEEFYKNMEFLEHRAKAYATAFELGVATGKDFQRAQLDLIEAYRRQAEELGIDTAEGMQAWERYMKALQGYQTELKQAQDKMINSMSKRFDILSEYIGLFPKGQQRGMNREFLEPLLQAQRDVLAEATLGEKDPMRQLDLLKNLVDTAKRFGEMDKGYDPFKGRFGGAKNKALDFLLGEGDQAEQLRTLIEQGAAVPMDPMQRTADNTQQMVMLLTQIQQQGASMLGREGINPQTMVTAFQQLVRAVIAQDYERATGLASRSQR